MSDALAYENFIQDNRPESDARVRIALLLPINLNKSFSDNKQNRYIEFYEGFLLAVDSIRSLGASIDIHVYDTETESIDNIIQKPELKKCNLIIGPVNNDEIEKMSRFSTENEICMVNPFSFDAKATEKNPFIFQYNTPYSYLYRSEERRVGKEC